MAASIVGPSLTNAVLTGQVLDYVEDTTSPQHEHERHLRRNLDSAAKTIAKAPIEQVVRASRAVTESELDRFPGQLGELFKKLKTDPRSGLADKEAASRLADPNIGYNELQADKQLAWWQVFLMQVRDEG